MGVSPLTGRKLTTLTTFLSSIQAPIHHTPSYHFTKRFLHYFVISPFHFRQCNGVMVCETCDKIKSLKCHSSSNIELLIRERLLISKFEPSLNGNISSTPLSLCCLTMSQTPRLTDLFNLIDFDTSKRLRLKCSCN